jgi:hypothetical protein
VRLLSVQERVAHPKRVRVVNGPQRAWRESFLLAQDNFIDSQTFPHGLTQGIVGLKSILKAMLGYSAWVALVWCVFIAERFYIAGQRGNEAIDGTVDLLRDIQGILDPRSRVTPWSDDSSSGAWARAEAALGSRCRSGAPGLVSSSRRQRISSTIAPPAEDKDPEDRHPSPPWFRGRERFPVTNNHFCAA